MIKLALIGCGNMGNAHKQRLGSLAGRMRVAATVDVVPERAESAKHMLGADLATTDYREALALVDAVLIATPHHLHHAIGMACIAAGKHVLMEKPLANTEVECLELIEAAEQRGVVLMVAYIQRYHPLIIQMGELIKAKTYGEPFHVSMWTEQFTRFPEADSWGHKAATLGGGQLFSHGCHYIDLMLDWMGEPAEGMHMGTNFGTPWMERDGTSEVAWVSVDVCQMPTALYNEIAVEVERACDIPKAQLFVTSTHTHNAATVGGVVLGHEVVDWAYVSYLKQQIVTVLLMAQRNKQSAVIGAAQAQNPRHVFNRRLRRPDGSIIMNWFKPEVLQGSAPAGPVDPAVQVLKIAHPDTHAPMAFVVNHALHNNAASPNKTAISADFSGVMADALRRVYGAHVITLFLPGAMGDINWIDPKTTHERTTLYREIGLSLAGTVMGADYDMAYIAKPRLDLGQITLHIPERSWDGDANALSDQNVFQLEAQLEHSPFYAAYTAWQAQGAPPLETFNVDLRVLALSDEVALVTNPSEFFVELGMAVKAQSPFKHTLVSTLTNGNIGYIPTRQAFAEGGYEVKKYPKNSFLDVSAGEQMVAASLDLLRSTELAQDQAR